MTRSGKASTTWLRRTVEAHRLVDGKYQSSDRIECADLTCAALAAQINWP
jgi:hypothetical protein